jgi:serine/threonine protein kinase
VRVLRKTGEIVALKEIPLQSSSVGIPCTAIREVGILQNVSHANIVHLKMVCRNSSRMTLVFEDCPGDLRQYKFLYNDWLPHTDVLSFSQQLLRGLAAVHSRGIIHRDIKPLNLLIGRDRVLKLCDFGLARVMDLPFCELSVDVVTQWYRPPEILLTFENYGLAVGIWSAACVTVEVGTGRPLFPARGTPISSCRYSGWPGPRSTQISQWGSSTLRCDKIITFHEIRSN